MANLDKAADESGVAPTQAGSVVTPGADPAPIPSTDSGTPAPPTSSPAPQPPEEPVVPASEPPTESDPVPPPAEPVDEVPSAPGGSVDETPEPGAADSQSISWTASEFVAHEKSAGWYAMLILGSLLLAALVYLVTKDAISVGVVVVAGILLAVYGSHQPRQLDYSVNNKGIDVGPQHYSYDSFKSFSVATEGAFSSLVLMPLKRFAIPLTIYYAPNDEDRILDIVSQQLPLEEHRRDAVDSLMHHIRF